MVEGEKKKKKEKRRTEGGTEETGFQTERWQQLVGREFGGKNESETRRRGNTPSDTSRSSGGGGNKSEKEGKKYRGRGSGKGIKLRVEPFERGINDSPTISPLFFLPPFASSPPPFLSFSISKPPSLSPPPPPLPDLHAHFFQSISPRGGGSKSNSTPAATNIPSTFLPPPSMIPSVAEGRGARKGERRVIFKTPLVGK